MQELICSGASECWQLSCRSGLKAELGAFYPLLLLRPLEAERPDPGLLYPALSALQELSAQPQLLVNIEPFTLSLSMCVLCGNLYRYATV
jgi:hypothetical protein